MKFWMCKTNLVCRGGKLDLVFADEAPGLPMSIRFGVEPTGDGEFDVTDVEMTDEFDVERIELLGEAKERAINILMSRPTLWEEFCIEADYNGILAV